MSGREEPRSEPRFRIMSVLAHPDDESLGIGGTLAKYAAEGAETCIVTATRGERGRFGEGKQHPGLEAVGRMREAELRAAADALGVDAVHILGYVDGDLDKADPEEATCRIVELIRRYRPDVVLTFGPDGAYGHPDHIAISQLTTAAVVAAADGRYQAAPPWPAHRVSKFYYMGWPEGKWRAYQSAFRKLTTTIDGIERQATPWPEWALTTVIDTEAFWPTVWKAVTCHKSQLALYGALEHLGPEEHKQLWGTQEFYRVFSLVNGGRRRETDLLEGLKDGVPGGSPEARTESMGTDVSSYPPPGTAANAERRAGVRESPVEMSPAQFRKLGHAVVDQVAEFLGSIAERPVTTAREPAEIRGLLADVATLPEDGDDPTSYLPSITKRLFEHSLHNGHPRFWGYVTSSAAPIGMLGDLIAAAVNSNVGAWALSPVATEMEKDCVRWISGLLGYRPDCGGVLVSGGNVANLVCFLAARRASAGPGIREKGTVSGGGRLRVYASVETHTWLQKAADISGLGTSAIRWIPVDEDLRIQPALLTRQIEADLKEGDRPFLVVGTAGTVSTGAIDPIRELASICRNYQLWLHVDGAYGAPAAIVPGLSADLDALREADSVAVDPHKWLYVPLEAGCALVARQQSLLDAFSYHPPYYHFDKETTNFFDYGLQNSRGFRALKVWLTIRHAGRSGYRKMISEDIRLARELHAILENHESLEPLSQGLSITTFRFVPRDLQPESEESRIREYLDDLNRRLLTRIERSGELFLSNAMVGGKFALRMCVVNFRTSIDDIRAVPQIVERHARKLDSEIRPTDLR